MENKLYILKNQQGEIICQKMLVANKLFDRLRGLMFSQELPNCDGFLICPCNSIHTFFMLYSLDVLFLDKEFKVIQVKYNLRPWLMTWIYFKANQVLEMKAGSMKKGLVVGDKLEAICIN